MLCAGKICVSLSIFSGKNDSTKVALKKSLCLDFAKQDLGDQKGEWDLKRCLTAQPV